ncbi:hypothetical protein ACIA8O_30995 [Kitasatospora sp. NPDC051853]
MRDHPERGGESPNTDGRGGGMAKWTAPAVARRLVAEVLGEGFDWY